MAERWVGAASSPPDWTNAALAAMERELHAWRVMPAGTEGYAKAEVTAGGVDTAELDAKTMESRKVPGLYFIGEVVDVTGWLGGYNFQWAWASGASAGGRFRRRHRGKLLSVPFVSTFSRANCSWNGAYRIRLQTLTSSP